MKHYEVMYAKRMVAEAALRLALDEIGTCSSSGGPRTGSYSGQTSYKVARALAQIAADQLRLSEAGVR